MRTIEIEVAIMNTYGVRANIIVPNVKWGIYFKDGGNLHECDLLILTKSGYATEIEIKVTKYDLLKDKEKWHNHDHKCIANFFFAVPEKLKEIALKEIPERAGLYVVRKVFNEYWKEYHYIVDCVKQCTRRPKALKWNENNRLKLAELGTMRILGLKRKLIK